ncbi:helix-turn-helix domain-containing protein [Companilactobacillus ginsenosidimutans]|uniref:HTH cro/C1-type domain-containing protein n=1 Tax=Companilactobacillus ginsenosidimutans TaxID=1007676 RepID=A0A0H4QKG8_9LACO|nr:helix-turn-helix transcriptional regulator [Companilactobacillus ginsenosidimutans]AKP67208.1 hypothetical protein ABM34_06435 [Companilactobacillus ginsenosidimutans]
MTKTVSSVNVLSTNDSKFKKAFAEAAAIHDAAVEVRHLRESLQMSPARFAKIVGKSQTTITRIESGSTNVSIGMLAEIAHSTGRTLRVSFE